MRQLKTLTCGSNLCNILGKPYEKNVIELIQYQCDDAKEDGTDNIEYHFYYNGTTTESQVKKFMANFKDYEQFIKIHKKHDYNTKNSWFLILTPDDCKTACINRAVHEIKEVNEQSIMRAFLNFYSMAKQQLQMSKNNKR